MFFEGPSKDNLDLDVDGKARDSWRDNRGLGGGGFCIVETRGVEVESETSPGPALGRGESDVAGLAPDFRVGGAGGGAVL